MKYALGNMLNGAGGLNPDGLSLDLQFAADKSLTARKGPTPVFTRGSSATQVGASGLIEYAPENLILRSQESSFWGITGSASKISTDSAVAPDGTMTADVVGFSGASGYLTSTVTSVASPVSATISCWVRVASETALFRLQIVDVPSPNFTATTTWQRFSHTGSLTSSYSGIRAASDGSSSTLEVWGLQVERSSTARAYIPTTTAAVYGARFDHDPLTLACRGLLIEEQRQNLILQSEDFGNTWLLTQSTVSTNVATAPNGLVTADKIIPSLSAAGLSRVGQVFTLTGAHTLSVFAKASEWGWILISYGPISNTGVWFNLTNGTIGTQTAGLVGSIIPYGNGWYKCVVSFTGAGTSLTARVRAVNADNESTLGDGTSGVFVWGAQLEAGSFPTSYIPTTTAGLTRSADVCSITGSAFTGFWNQSEGTLLSQTQKASTNANAFIISASDGSFGNETDLRYNSVSVVAALINVSSISQVSGFQANITSGAAVKASIAYKLNDCAYAANGASPVLDTSALIPTVDRLTIGNVAVVGNNFYMNGHIASIRYYKKRLANAKLQQLTT